MKLIEVLSDKISEEISDAKAYAEMALQYRDGHPDLARTFHALSTEEMEHATRLHGAVAEVIDRYRAEKGPPPPAMQAVYDYLHKQQIGRSAEVKNLQSMYKS